MCRTENQKETVYRRKSDAVNHYPFFGGGGMQVLELQGSVSESLVAEIQVSPIGEF
jgi:hypothetical protein